MRIEEESFFDDDDDKKKLRNWREWLRNIPSAAKSVKIQAVYRSCSTLLLLSMPIVIWDLLPATSAYSFIGLLASDNLVDGILHDNSNMAQAMVNIPPGMMIVQTSFFENMKTESKYWKSKIIEKNSLIKGLQDDAIILNGDLRKLRYEAIMLNDKLTKASESRKASQESRIDASNMQDRAIGFVPFLQSHRRSGYERDYDNEIDVVDSHNSTNNYGKLAHEFQQGDAITTASQRLLPSNVPCLILPQAATAYCIAKVSVHLSSPQTFRQKAIFTDCSKFCRCFLHRAQTQNKGRDIPEGGRELIVLDENEHALFKHTSKFIAVQLCDSLLFSLPTVKTSEGESCFPYTWSKNSYKRSPSLRNDHALEVGFEGTKPNAHTVLIGLQLEKNTVPKYVFVEREDFEDFQSEVRRKLFEYFIDLYDVRYENGKPIAKDQRLTIWRDQLSKANTLSFYANKSKLPGFVEFPLSMFHGKVMQWGSKIGLEIASGDETNPTTRDLSNADDSATAESHSSVSYDTGVPSTMIRVGLS